jgi:peptidyl-prolyl cis-trans isomerase C
MQTVTVNDVTIPHATIAREVQNHAAASPDAAWQQAARALVIRELLLQRAGALELVAEPRVQDGARETDDEATIRLLLEREISTPTADEATCRRYYDSHRKRFRSADLFEPAHILV